MRRFITETVLPDHNRNIVMRTGAPKNKTAFHFIFFLLKFLLIFYAFFSCGAANALAQTYSAQFTSGQSSSGNYLRNSAAFRQEIMRMEINVTRGNKSLPITQVPRVQKADVIKMHLLDEAVGGIKPDESLWNWTFLVAFVNPNRKGVSEGAGSSVSQEIQFRKTGWYREYTFEVPYDSQPVFFLYPRPKYRDKILKLVNKKYEEVRKLGDKTIELAGAYAQIDSFINELQGVLARTQSSMYGPFTIYPNQSSNNGSNPYNPYGSGYGGYNPYNSYNPYNGGYNNGNNNNYNPYEPIRNYNALLEQTVERLAASFNLTLPSCWQTTNGGLNFGGYGNGGYGSYNSGGYGSYGSSGYGSNYSNNQNLYHAVSADFVGRAQCVARSIRLEDFDFSVSKLLKEGGIFAATQLRDKYPQLSYWISVAAVAIDFIVKVFQKYPLRIVPAIIQTSDNNGYGSVGSSGGGYGSYQAQNNYAPNPNNPSSQNPAPVKISLFAEAQPGDDGAVTAYPIVVHRWQQEPDQEIVSLRAPVLTDPCLHTGVNILKSTDLQADESADVFSKDFKLVLSSDNGFRKEIPLRKNLGAGGWELNLTPEDFTSFPKIQMTLEAEIMGARGFNEIKSPKFSLPVNTPATWQIKPEAQKAFAVGGRRTITLQNLTGDCRCLQAVIYKPSFGGQFIFEANAKDPNNQLQFSSDGREVSFTIDATNFQPGAGTLELKSFGDNQPQQSQYAQPNQQQSNVLNIKLYPPPPEITDFKIAGGDRQASITGTRLEQLQWIKVNGKRMTIAGSNSSANQSGQPNPSNQPAQLNQPAPVNTYSPNSANAYSNNSSTERTVVFDDPNTKQEGGVISLELGLDDDRSFQYPAQFRVKPPRPTIVANNNNEVDSTIVSSSNNSGGNKGNPSIVGNIAKPTGVLKAKQTNNSSFDIGNLPIFPIDTKEISVSVQNALTDYDFKPENITIETRIENGQGVTSEMPRVSFEIFDWKSMRLSIEINDQINKIIGGRRLQFRIRDRERGDSEWYTVRQTFVRLPEIKSVRCMPQMNGQCEIKGYGIEYLGQVSVNGGLSWFPNENSTLQVQQNADGKSTAWIPHLENKNMFLIRFRDFPKMDGINLSNFLFSSLMRMAKGESQQLKSNKPVILSQPNQPIQVANSNLPSAQKSIDLQNQPVDPRSKRKLKPKREN